MSVTAFSALKYTERNFVCGHRYCSSALSSSLGWWYCHWDWILPFLARNHSHWSLCIEIKWQDFCVRAFSLKDSMRILDWMTVLRNKIYAHMQKSCYFISMEKLQWLWLFARNGRSQSQGQYYYPGIDDSPEEQNLCPACKNAVILFQWRNSSGCNFLQRMAEFSLEDSITILGWMTVLRNKIYTLM